LLLSRRSCRSSTQTPMCRLMLIHGRVGNSAIPC
jgi:hypothetical protein